MLERVAEGGLIAPPAPLVVMLSGGRDSVCMLDLAVRAAGAEAVTALHVNYGLRDDSDEDERHCAALCERLGVGLEVERPRRPEGPGNLQAWARDSRYAAAAAAGAAAAGRRSSPATPPTTRWRRSSTGSPPRRAAGRCWGCAPHDGSLARPLLGTTRAETTAYCEERGLGWREDTSNDEPPTPATGSATACCRSWRRSTRRRRPTSCARRSCCATRPRCSTPWSTPSSTARGGAPAARSRSQRLAELHPALRRLVLQRLADARRRAAGPRRRPLRRAGRRPAPHRHRDARPRRRRPRRGRGRCAPRRAPTLAPHISRLRPVSDPAIGEILVCERGPAAPRRRARAPRSAATTPAASWSWSGC